MTFNSKTARANRGKVLGIALVGFLMVALGLGIFLAPSSQVSAQTTTNGSTINVFCLDFGKSFPEGQTIKALGLADSKIRGGLAYALSKGYVTSQPYQVQLAMWQLQDGQPFHNLQNADTAIAQEIVDNATKTALPASLPAGLDSLTLANIHESSSLSAYGTATLQGTVDTQGLPVGFLLPASAGNFQNMVAVVSTGSAVQVSTAAATTAAATTAAATTVAATTAAPTTVPVTTVASTTAPATTVAPTTAPATTVAPTTAPATTAPATTVAPTTAPVTTVAPTTVVFTTAPSTVSDSSAGPTNDSTTSQGGAPAAPATGFGGNDGNFIQTLGMILLVAGVSVLGLAGLIGLRITSGPRAQG